MSCITVMNTGALQVPGCSKNKYKRSQRKQRQGKQIGTHQEIKYLRPVRNAQERNSRSGCQRWARERPDALGRCSRDRRTSWEDSRLGRHDNLTFLPDVLGRCAHATDVLLGCLHIGYARAALMLSYSEYTRGYTWYMHAPTTLAPNLALTLAETHVRSPVERR
ncbi:hypothetical protein BGX38DRAFT_1215774 [Terfezia claveryi]|nr:hypothetical protein BGX38DRAFT_1215774 [Terfezia claveryi]